MDEPLWQQLAEGMAALQQPIDEQQMTALMTYLQLISRWNKAYNLTAIRDLPAMVVRHLLDSLAILPHLPDGSLLDVGTGAGLPGVPLAIMQPNRQVALLDSNGKKIRFLFQVKTQLGLSNIQLHETRVEQFAAQERPDLIVSRAFASLSDMVKFCQPLLSHGARLFAMKGADVDAELEVLQKNWPAMVPITQQPLRVPGLNETRWLVELRAATH